MVLEYKGVDDVFSCKLVVMRATQHVSSACDMLVVCVGCHGDVTVMPEIQILINQDIREVFTLFLYCDIILESSY